MEDNKYLRWSFWVLVYGIGPVLILGLFSGGARIESAGSMIFLGILALVWIWLSDLGKEALREMT